MGDMFQCKIDEIFSDMPNLFGIVDDILVIGYDEDGADHDVAVHKVLQQYEEVSLKLNKEKCYFRCTSIPFFGEVISRKGVPARSTKGQGTDGHAATKQQKRTAGLLRYCEGTECVVGIWSYAYS